MAKHFLDWSTFTDPHSGLDLLRRTIPATNDFDALAARKVKGKFTAVIISDVMPLSAAESAGMPGGNSASDNSNLVAKYYFKARIDPKMNPISPHVMLEDPCAISFSVDPYRAMNVIMMHTTFIFTTAPGATADDIPALGDIIEVGLFDGDAGGYDLQYGVFMRKVAPGTGGTQGATTAQSLQASCSTMKEMFDNMPAFDPGDMGVNVINDLSDKIKAHPTYKAWDVPTGIIGKGVDGVTTTAQTEIDFWNGRKESNNSSPMWAQERLTTYWRNLNAMWGLNGKEPWSAAFISYVIQQNDLSFPGSAAHMNYAHTGFSRLVAGNTSGWLTFDVTEKVKVKVGDVFVKPRGGSYTNSHGDVVYKIENGKAHLAGGNVSDTAKDVGSITVDSAGYISNAGPYLVVVKKV